MARPGCTLAAPAPIVRNYGTAITIGRVMHKSVVDRALQELGREFPSVDATSKGIVYSVFFLANHFSKTGGRILEGFGLSWGEYLVISTLRRAGARSGMSPSAISDSIGMSTGGLSNLLRRLESAGLIKRAPSARDGRGVQVTTTARGRKLAEVALAAISESQQSHVGALVAAKRASLYVMLRSLVRHFEFGTISSTIGVAQPRFRPAGRSRGRDAVPPRAARRTTPHSRKT